MAVERLEAVPFVVVVFSLKVFADAARRKKVKRLLHRRKEKERKKEEKFLKTPLFLLSLSLSPKKKTTTKKTRTKGRIRWSLPSLPLLFLRREEEVLVKVAGMKKRPVGL